MLVSTGNRAKEAGTMPYALSDPEGWAPGDYAVDHGHADDFYAPSAAHAEAEAIRRECAAERPASRADAVLITRPY